MMKAIWLRMLRLCVNWAGYDRRQQYVAVDQSGCDWAVRFAAPIVWGSPDCDWRSGRIERAGRRWPGYDETSRASWIKQHIVHNQDLIAVLLRDAGFYVSDGLYEAVLELAGE